MTAPAVQPNNDLAMLAFIRHIAPDPDRVALTLPDQAVWQNDGAFLVPSVVGGSPGLYTGLRQPVCQLDVFATNTSSAKVPWNRAAEALEHVVRRLLEFHAFPISYVLPTRPGYGPVRVHDAAVVTEPRRVPGDESRGARLAVDWWLVWTPA